MQVPSFAPASMHDPTLSESQRALLPTDEDVAFYETHGYYVSKPGVLPDELIEQGVRGAERLYRGDLDRPLPIADGYARSRVRDDRSPRNDEFVSLQVSELSALVRWPLIGAIAARLTRSPSIRLLDDQLVWKPGNPERPATTITGWHADGAYWSTCSSSKLVTAWVPLHDIAHDGGPLVVMAGSHRWPDLQDLRHFNVQDLDRLQQRFREEGRRIEIVPMTLRKGQVSFHHAWTVHASLPNVGSRPRLAMAIHMQDGDNRYRPFTTAEGREIHIFDEQLCRRLPNGDPDFADPEVFPELWSEAC